MTGLQGIAPHLHFGLEFRGQYVDPAPLLPPVSPNNMGRYLPYAILLTADGHLIDSGLDINQIDASFTLPLNYQDVAALLAPGGTQTSTINLELASTKLGSRVLRQWTVRPPRLTVTKNGAGSGTVSSVSTRIACGIGCTSQTGLYPEGTETLSALANSGSRFSGWSGDCSGTVATAPVTLTRDKLCIATFDKTDEVTLTVRMDMLIYQAYPTCLSTPGGCISPGLFPAGSITTPDGLVQCNEPGLGYTDYAYPTGLVPVHRLCSAKYAKGSVVPIVFAPITYPMGQFPGGGSLIIPTCTPSAFNPAYLWWRSYDSTGKFAAQVFDTLNTFVTMDQDKLVTVSSPGCGI
jgi:hypothetical protein